MTVDEMPAHYHDTISGTGGSNRSNVEWAATVSSTDTRSRGTEFIFCATQQTGGSNAHNNMQPYVTVYAFHRTV